MFILGLLRCVSDQELNITQWGALSSAPLCLNAAVIYEPVASGLSHLFSRLQTEIVLRWGSPPKARLPPVSAVVDYGPIPHFKDYPVPTSGKAGGIPREDHVCITCVAHTRVLPYRQDQAGS